MPKTTETNPVGERLLERFSEGDATREQVDAAHAKGWISDADYKAATK